jgi:hypothetical protein
MKHFFIIIFFFSINLFGQTNPLFEIEYKEMEMDKKGNGFYSLKPNSENFYEDENYTVSDSCRGEFGGNIYFKDKVTKEQYSLHATCPLIINKLNNIYYLTTSLAHMSGFCSLYEIDDPKELTKVDISDFNDYGNMKSVLGAKPLINEIGSTILISFIYKEKLYHIVSDRDKTYVAERETAELKRIQQVTELRMYSYGSETCKTKENHYAAIFQTNKNQGYIEIYENKIKIILYK